MCSNKQISSLKRTAYLLCCVLSTQRQDTFTEIDKIQIFIPVFLRERSVLSIAKMNLEKRGRRKITKAVMNEAHFCCYHGND